MAATAGSSPSGMARALRDTKRAGTSRWSAKAPFRYSSSGHRFSRPALHSPHTPHEAELALAGGHRWITVMWSGFNFGNPGGTGFWGSNRLYVLAYSHADRNRYPKTHSRRNQRRCDGSFANGTGGTNIHFVSDASIGCRPEPALYHIYGA